MGRPSRSSLKAAYPDSPQTSMPLASNRKRSSNAANTTSAAGRRSTRLSYSRTTSIPNTSDAEEESSSELSNIEIGLPTARRVLKEVVIPTMARSTRSSLFGGGETTKASVSTTSSSESGTREDSFEYDTPATSISTTPALSLSKGKGRVSVNDTLPRALGKRKLASRKAEQQSEDEIVVDTSADAELARALQEEEYNGGAESKRPKLGESSRTPINDMNWLDASVAEDDEDDLSSALSIASDESFDVQPYNGKGKGKATASRRGRPSRAAQRSARKSFRGLDQEDSEMLSVADSADEEFLLDDSAFENESISDDSDDAPLMDRWKASPASNEPIMASSSKQKQETQADKDRKARKKLSDRQRKKEEASKRARRYAHIHDRWERKRAINRDRLEEAHPKLRTMWTDLGRIPVIEPVEANQPEAISRKLKSFQLKGLDWMTKQEKTQYKGGLLGDEMGMGKTIQAVSLIMSDYPQKEPTLVVVPPVALMQWSNEIREYTNGKLKVLVYHGTNSKVKNLSVNELKKYDVIMVSYNSLESVYRKESKGWSRGEHIIKEASPLHAIMYHRLILDEAHSIKSRTTGVAKACFALKGKYKWCLSGTPVQNRIGEFFSLLRFLEVRPFADYFCRSCDCEQLHWSLDEDHMCAYCKHSGAEHISVFNQELLNPITGDDPRLREQAMDKLHMITARMMLRRMKRDHTSSMELPPKEIIIHNEFFGPIERDFSSSIMTNSTRTFDTYVSRGVMLNNYANIFGLIMQMRQVANHPDLLLKKHAEGGQNVLVCNICDEPAEEAIRSRCHHEFCRSCVKSYVESCEGSGTTADCPRCHIALSIDFEQPDIEQDEDLVKKSSIINRIKMENWTSSTKIEMLVYDLYKLRSKKQTLKSIVFSQFTSMLQLIEWRLRRAGFNTVMLDGSMTPAQRQKSIEYFMNNAEVEVFLVSLKAGGVALNLTEASRVFIVDPWWNPAAEWQSADRCHRIGQKRPCVITRLCIEDSVESRMVMLQEKKAAMISGTINNDKVAMEKLSPEDLQFLFRGT